MLAARGLREDDEFRYHRMEREFLIAVRRQGMRVGVASALGAALLTALAAMAIRLAS